MTDEQCIAMAVLVADHFYHDKNYNDCWVVCSEHEYWHTAAKDVSHRSKAAAARKFCERHNLLEEVT